MVLMSVSGLVSGEAGGCGEGVASMSLQLEPAEFDCTSPGLHDENLVN